MKKKSFIKMVLIIILLSLSVGYIDTTAANIEVANNDIIIAENYQREISELRNKYNNSDIVAYLEIPNYLKVPIVQTINNDYYLHYDIYKKENIIGASFLDYRTKLGESRKLLIYSHSDPEGTLPFVKLTNYNKKDFFEKNRSIYLVDSNTKREYEVFSAYIETKDFDYVNLENFNGLTYKEHLDKLKSKSLVNSDIELSEESKVLILQTCSFENINTNTKYQLVIAKEK